MKHQVPLRPPRGRPRGFDTEAAIERAMGVFWSRGYNATALPDLLRATKLSRGSLYAAFGDKHGLFLRALDRYIAAADACWPRPPWNWLAATGKSIAASAAFSRRWRPGWQMRFRARRPRASW